MKRIMICLLILSAGLLCHAQTEQSAHLAKKREAIAWYDRGLTMYVQDYDSAYRSLGRAAALFRELEMKRDEATVTRFMASIMVNKHQKEKALPLLADAEEVAVESGDTALLVSILTDRMEILYGLGRMRERRAIMDRLAKLLPKGHAMDMTDGYILRGHEAEMKKDYRLAEYYYLLTIGESEKLQEQLRMSGKYRGYLAMMNLRYSEKRYAESMEYGKKVLEYGRKMGDTKEDFALTYMRIASSYVKCHDKQKALLYMDSANSCVGDNVDEAVLMFSGEGLCLLELGMNREALRVLERADRMIVERDGVYDARREYILTLKGSTLYKMGKYEKCAETYMELEKLTERVYGRGAKEHIEAMDGVANSMAFAGNISGGASKFVEMVKIMQGKVKEEMGSLTLSEREAYWSEFSGKMIDMTSFGLQGKIQSEEFITTACEALMFTQSLLLESDVSIQELVNDHGTDEEREWLRMMRTAENRIKELSKDYNSNGQQIAELEEDVERYERLLCANFKRYGEYVDFLNIRLSDVVAAMPEKSILIDFNDIITPRKHFHAAFVTKKSDGRTDMRLIFDWGSVEALLNGDPIDDLYGESLNDSARRAIWEPLSEFAEEGCIVYYVPTGKMHQISLESFTAEDGKLLSEHYKFVRLSSARELVRKSEGKKMPERAVLYGGLIYEMSRDSMLAESRGESRGDSVFRELRYSKEEIESIGNLLEKAGVKVSPFSGVQGSEESFVSMSGNAPGIIHIATHGYYFTPEEAVKVRFVGGSDDAMMRSGLVMSGANAARRGEVLEEGGRDGLLNGVDISAVNLRGVDLVVLSACQTGLGKVTSEGIYGLQRAFKLAGVKTIVMTLWSVDDRVTKEFMVKFYERLVVDGWDKRRAFDEARNYIRGLHPKSPYYWAGFVMVD